jgi:hypothetical protein
VLIPKKILDSPSDLPGLQLSWVKSKFTQISYYESLYYETALVMDQTVDLLSNFEKRTDPKEISNMVANAMRSSIIGVSQSLSDQ